MNFSEKNPNKALWEKGDFTQLANLMRQSGDALVASLEVAPPLKVLDLGCGDGTTAVPLAKLGAELSAHPDPAIAAQGARATAEAQRAMFAMQYHDQLAQRVQHVRDALGDLHDALDAPNAPATAVLLAAIRTRYTMEDERRLFDVVLGHLPGAPPANANSENEALRGSVELF